MTKRIFFSFFLCFILVLLGQNAKASDEMAKPFISYVENKNIPKQNTVVFKEMVSRTQLYTTCCDMQVNCGYIWIYYDDVTMEVTRTEYFSVCDNYGVACFEACYPYIG